MFGRRDASRRLGSRRLGGPILFKDLWLALREDLREVYVARGGPTPLDPVLAVAGPTGAEETASTSFSRAA
jgi:hypothetical protein